MYCILFFLVSFFCFPLTGVFGGQESTDKSAKKTIAAQAFNSFLAARKEKLEAGEGEMSKAEIHQLLEVIKSSGASDDDVSELKKLLEADEVLNTTHKKSSRAYLRTLKENGALRSVRKHASFRPIVMVLYPYYDAY